VLQRRPVEQPEAARAVHQHALRAVLGDDLAQVRLARHAVATRATRRDEAEHDAIAGRDVRDVGADRLDDPGALVAEDDRPVPLAELAVCVAQVGVADARSRDADEDFAALRRVELDVLDRHRPARVPEHCRPRPHAARPRSGPSARPRCGTPPGRLHDRRPRRRPRVTG
jgi:hypothetical protein